MSAGPEKKPIGYNAASSALMNAIERKRLPAHIVDIRDELFDKPVGGSLGLIAIGAMCLSLPFVQLFEWTRMGYSGRARRC
jgi:hypothetical protein